jgi:hypothetical protein
MLWNTDPLRDSSREAAILSMRPPRTRSKNAWNANRTRIITLRPTSVGTLRLGRTRS